MTLPGELRAFSPSSRSFSASAYRCPSCLRHHRHDLQNVAIERVKLDAMRSDLNVCRHDRPLAGADFGDD
jgi:hypothetical protein